MIIIRLKGGLGNQMFQYAFGRQLAESLQCPLKLDLSSLLDRSKGDFVYRDFDLPIFHIEEDVLVSRSWLKAIHGLKSSRISKWVKNRVTSGRNHIKEPHFHVAKDILQEPQYNTVYEGWWQSEQYFEDVADRIRKEFQLKQAPLAISEELLAQIETTNSVCLNVRRTDFLKVDTLNTTNKDYFVRAAQLLGERVERPTFFVFSDDMKWCQQELELPFSTVFVQHEMKGEKFGNYHRLMRACKHFIIPNSSFAWWAVWLNENPNKHVVAPKNWFNDPSIDTSDLVPDTWVRI